MNSLFLKDANTGRSIINLKYSQSLRDRDFQYRYRKKPSHFLMPAEAH